MKTTGYQCHSTSARLTCVQQLARNNVAIYGYYDLCNEIPLFASVLHPASPFFALMRVNKQVAALISVAIITHSIILPINIWWRCTNVVLNSTTTGAVYRKWVTALCQVSSCTRHEAYWDQCWANVGPAWTQHSLLTGLFYLTCVPNLNTISTIIAYQFHHSHTISGKFYSTQEHRVSALSNHALCRFTGPCDQEVICMWS